MFKRKHKIDLAEIHQYTQDMERITLLRDKSDEEAEVDRYDNIIEVMQLCLMHLHEPNHSF